VPLGMKVVLSPGHIVLDGTPASVPQKWGTTPPPNVQCVCLAAGRRTQAGDATDQWRDQWVASLSASSSSKEDTLNIFDIKTAGCDS